MEQSFEHNKLLGG